MTVIPEVLYHLADETKERSLYLVYRFKKPVLIAVLLLLCVYVGYDRYQMQSYILELERRVANRDYRPYVEGVKDGLRFKKNQKGHVP